MAWRELAVVSWLVSGCGGGAASPALLEAAAPGEAFEGAQCAAVRPPTEPDLMAWDSGSRANLKLLHERGVVAVRYQAEGCNVELEVLNCTGAGDYAFSPYGASESKVARSASDLYAELPLGAARLTGKVGGGRSLRTDYLLAGILATRSFSAFPRSQLAGTGCERATHVVAKLYVGGFAMASGVSDQVEGGASFFGVGAGVDQQRSAERIASEGDAAACGEAQRTGKLHPLCSVPLRVGLVPIEGGVAPAPAAPAPSVPPSAPLPPSVSPQLPGPVDPASQPGRLDVASNPWGVVTIDGKVLGPTPILATPLSPGLHTVVVHHPPTGASAQRRVTIVAGQRQSMSVTLGR